MKMKDWNMAEWACLAFPTTFFCCCSNLLNVWAWPATYLRARTSSVQDWTNTAASVGLKSLKGKLNAAKPLEDHDFLSPCIQKQTRWSAESTDRRPCRTETLQSFCLNVWPPDELLPQMKVPKRCLSVHLYNIHQQWILMSDLSEKGEESSQLGKRPPCVEPRFPGATCEQTLTWMSVCQTEAPKIPPLCSLVQLSPTKNDIYSAPHGYRKYPRRGDSNTKYERKHWGSTLMNHPKVKGLLKGTAV